MLWGSRGVSNFEFKLLMENNGLYLFDAYERKTYVQSIEEHSCKLLSALYVCAAPLEEAC